MTDRIARAPTALSNTSQGSHGRAVTWAAFFTPLLVAALGAACSPASQEQPSVTLAGLDSALSELGGQTTADLFRGQRWRMISSIGAGLPLQNFQAEDLPDPSSRGAGLLQLYCVQCHWLSAPQMHSAAEWPILVRRMVMRSRTLRDRLGGPLTSGLVGEYLMEGIRTTDLPSPAELDTLIIYLQEHALPAAEPGDLTDGPDAALYVEMCSICHETPSPKAHSTPEWESVVARMLAYMSAMALQPPTNEQIDRIIAYLKERAAS